MFLDIFSSAIVSRVFCRPSPFLFPVSPCSALFIINPPAWCVRSPLTTCPWGETSRRLCVSLWHSSTQTYTATYVHTALSSSSTGVLMCGFVSVVCLCLRMCVCVYVCVGVSRGLDPRPGDHDPRCQRLEALLPVGLVARQGRRRCVSCDVR